MSRQKVYVERCKIRTCIGARWDAAIRIGGNLSFNATQDAQEKNRIKCVETHFGIQQRNALDYEEMSENTPVFIQRDERS